MDAQSIKTAEIIKKLNEFNQLKERINKSDEKEKDQQDLKDENQQEEN